MGKFVLKGADLACFLIQDRRAHQQICIFHERMESAGIKCIVPDTYELTDDTTVDEANRIWKEVAEELRAQWHKEDEARD